MIYDIFLKQVTATPHAIAIVNSHGQRFTYLETLHTIHQWANYLLQQDIHSGDCVAVLLDDEDRHFVIFAALDRINASYTPFDADIPPLQLDIDISTLQLKKFIIDNRLQEKYVIAPNIALSLSTEILQTIHSLPTIAPALEYQTNGFEKISYIVSSSGSTGNKKWIPLPGAGLLYWAGLEKKRNDTYPAPKVLSTRSPAYDARIAEYVITFSSGSTLYLLNRMQRKNMSSILSICEKESINKMLLIASQLSSDNAEKLVAKLTGYGLTDLMVTGDACTPQLKELCEHTKLRLWNAYGPTEAVFGISVLLVNGQPLLKTDSQLIVPIGKPEGEGVSYYIIDGKLYIESIYLTPGYLLQESNDTAFKWLDPNGNGQLKRLFDTGDSFSDQQGLLCYQGRHQYDTHSKVGGVKVTPFFLEQCLNDYKLQSANSLLQVAVVIKPYLKQNRPFAYIVVTPDFDPSAFRTYIKSRLELEKRPLIIKLDDLPRLSPSNKVDLRQLITREDPPSQFLFNDNQPEKLDIPADQKFHHALIIKKIWSEVFQLPQDQIDGKRDFDALGGDSGKLVEIGYKINQAIDPRYGYENLLRLQTITIDTIAASIDDFQHQPQNPEYIPLQRAFIKQLTETKRGRTPLFLLPALLGEGYFSYKHFGQRLIQIELSHYTVYGLSDPGIADEILLPETLEQATKRYIAAIQTMQPHGPYTIGGFSFGCTLAYEVVKLLQQQGEQVINLHLFDGFPPYFYQSLSNDAHLQHLESLLNFMMTRLNNSFYRESLQPIKLDRSVFQKLSKVEQVEQSFQLVAMQIQHAASRRTLLMAQRHLNFLLNAPKPSEKLAVRNIMLYLTKENQPYNEGIKQVFQISADSVDYRYCGWNRYFQNMILNDRRLECDHLGLLSKQPRTPQHTAESYWSIGGNWFMSSLQSEHFGPSSFYRLEPIDNRCTYQLSVFFLCYASAITLKQSLTELELDPTTDFFDKNVRRSEKNESSYSALANIFCTIPEEKRDAVKRLLKKRSFTQATPAHLPFRRQLMSPDDNKQQGQAHILIFREDDSLKRLGVLSKQHLLTLSFDYSLFPSALIAAAKKHLNLEPIEGITSSSLTFHYYSKLQASIDDIIQDSAYFLADFIAILKMNQIQTTAPNASKITALTTLSAIHPHFFKPKLTAANLETVIKRLISIPNST